MDQLPLAVHNRQGCESNLVVLLPTPLTLVACRCDLKHFYPMVALSSGKEVQKEHLFPTKMLSPLKNFIVYLTEKPNKHATYPTAQIYQ
jgi:hypothetical protein